MLSFFKKKSIENKAMFIFNLSPFPLKCTRGFYYWMGLVALKNFKASEITLLGAEWHLNKPSKQVHAPWVINNFVKNKEELDKKYFECNKVLVPTELINNTVDSFNNPMDFFKYYVNEGIPAYTDFLLTEMQKIQEKTEITAVITWHNDKSLEDACAILGIRVIHMEAGNLRAPTAKLSTFYFDFKGVNGNSSAEERSAAATDIKKKYAIHLPQLRSYLYKKHILDSIDINSIDTYEIGIPLQVEDDSNVVLFNKNYTILDLLYQGSRFFASKKVLIREHPASHLGIRDQSELTGISCRFGIIDKSNNSLDFVYKCKRIFTLNSSVALDAMLSDKITIIFGDSPMAYLTNNSIDRKLRLGKKKINYAEELTWYTIGYLIPSKFWMNPEYIKWRLTEPSEEEIFLKHKAVWDEVNI